MSTKRTKGKIVKWNDAKAFGFISPFSGGKQLFMHINALSNRTRRPTVGDVVTYSVSKDRQGRPCATNAVLAGTKQVKRSSVKPSTTAISVAIVFLLVVAATALLGAVPAVILFVYLGLSLVAFLFYALDKSAAKSGSWRVAEGTLLMLGLLGGWPGALVASQTLRHKSSKGSFRAAFWGTVVLNVAAFVWLQTESGRELLKVLSG